MHYRVNEQEDVIIDTDGHKDALTNNESIPCDEVPPSVTEVPSENSYIKTRNKPTRCGNREEPPLTRSRARLSQESLAGDPAGSFGGDSPVLFNAVQHVETGRATTNYTSDVQLPYKVEILMWKMTCFKNILKELNDSEGHCVTLTDGECELDYGITSSPGLARQRVGIALKA